MGITLRFGAWYLGFICFLVLGIWNLFVFWCLVLVILDTKLQGRVIISNPRNAGQAWPIDDPAMRGGPSFQYKNKTETT